MMIRRPKGLGRGLDALLGDSGGAVVEAPRGAPQTLALEQLRPGRYQPRTKMDPDSLSELADSIRAHGVIQLVQEFGFTHEQAAQAIGRSRSATTNLLRLLNLAGPVQQLLMDGALEMGHARALLPLQSSDQIQLGQNIAARGLSVREAEAMVERALRPARSRASARPAAD